MTLAAALGLGAFSGRFWGSRSSTAALLLRLGVGGALAASGAAGAFVLLATLAPPQAFGFGGFFGGVLLTVLAWPLGALASIFAAKRIAKRATGAGIWRSGGE